METINQRLQRSLCFAEVARSGSFTTAARALGCSKAHVSRQVQLLEKELGAQLLLRSTRRLELTPLGRTYAEYAQRMRDALDEADQAVSATRSEVAGRLFLTAATSFGEAFLVELVEAFRQRHPGTEVELDLSIQRRDLLADRVDFAFRSTRTVDEHLVAHALGVVRDLPVASPALLQRYPAINAPADLAALPCIHNSHFRDEHEWVFLRGAESATVRVRSMISINHFGAIQRAAELGAGVARLPSYLIEDAIAAGRLRRLLPDWDIHPTPIYLVHPLRRHSSLLQRVFREFVVEWFRREEVGGRIV